MYKRTVFDLDDIARERKNVINIELRLEVALRY